MNTAPLLAFYGDDFTGSTDALEAAAIAGAKAALFLEAPDAALLARYPGIQVVGVAGMTRSLGTAEIESELRPALAALRALGPRHLHYKVCSTFDSSPSIGSIGRATEVGSSVCAGAFVPLLVGAPQLGRYCVFGNLYARMGTAGAGAIYRLDRHPGMSRHPVTPMDEADLRLHLAKQTRKRIGLLDLLNLDLPAEARVSKLRELVAGGFEVILFDILEGRDLAAIGAMIDAFASPGKPFFSVGSSSVETALGDAWAAQGLLKQRAAWADLGPSEPLLVVSGSCSPVTERQISQALTQGFREVPLDAAVAAGEGAEFQLRQIESEVGKLLRSGKSVIVHTCRGGDDPRFSSGARAFKSQGASGTDSVTQAARSLGGALGRIAASALAASGIRRLVVAGGDTSTYAARALGIEALEMIAPIVPGAPLCVARAPGCAVDGIEVNFKGGQVGGDDYFERLSRGARQGSLTVPA